MLEYRCPQHMIGEPDEKFYYLCDDCMAYYVVEPDDLDASGNHYDRYAEYEASQQAVADRSPSIEEMDRRLMEGYHVTLDETADLE
jgi:hypothetical protein